MVWIEEALRSLDRDLQQRYGRGAAILFRRGTYSNELQAVASATDSGAIYYNRRWVPSVTAGSDSLFICAEIIVWSASTTGLKESFSVCGSRI